jgi:hypothetical protein
MLYCSRGLASWRFTRLLEIYYSVILASLLFRSSGFYSRLLAALARFSLLFHKAVFNPEIIRVQCTCRGIINGLHWSHNLIPFDHASVFPFPPALLCFYVLSRQRFVNYVRLIPRPTKPQVGPLLASCSPHGGGNL